MAIAKMEIRIQIGDNLLCCDTRTWASKLTCSSRVEYSSSFPPAGDMTRVFQNEREECCLVSVALQSGPTMKSGIHIQRWERPARCARSRKQSHPSCEHQQPHPRCPAGW